MEAAAETEAAEAGAAAEEGVETTALKRGLV